MTAINERLIEFDDRIFHINEQRGGSISLKLQEAIRDIRRYPDSLQQLYLGASNFEARLGTVEQNALLNKFGVDYYRLHTPWFYEIIQSGNFSDFKPHYYAMIKQAYMRNLPCSRSLAEDRHQTHRCRGHNSQEIEIHPGGRYPTRYVGGTPRGWDDWQGFTGQCERLL